MPQRKWWHGKGVPAMGFWRWRLSVHLQREVITARRPDHNTRAASGRRRAARRKAVAQRKAEQCAEQQDSAVQRGGKAPTYGLDRKGQAETTQGRKTSCCVLSVQRVEHMANIHQTTEQTIPFTIALLQEQVLGTKARHTGLQLGSIEERGNVSHLIFRRKPNASHMCARIKFTHI
jgi:hypothetical protein